MWGVIEGILAVIGAFCVCLLAYWYLETLYFEWKTKQLKNQDKGKDTEYDKGFRDGQMASNM